MECKWWPIHKTSYWLPTHNIQFWFTNVKNVTKFQSEIPQKIKLYVMLNLKRALKWSSKQFNGKLMTEVFSQSKLCSLISDKCVTIRTLVNGNGKWIIMHEIDNCHTSDSAKTIYYLHRYINDFPFCVCMNVWSVKTFQFLFPISV